MVQDTRCCDEHTVPEPSLTSLLSGIVNDTQELIRQEIELAKVEIRGELRKTKEAVVAMLTGVACVALGGIFLLLMLVFLIYWASGHVIPIWGAFGIVGFTLAVLGAILVYTGLNRAERIHIIPRQTAETFRENVQWMRTQL
jgi:uncharacterized membrane protein YqjE